MATEGIQLTSFYVAAPSCTPSRAAFFFYEMNQLQAVRGGQWKLQLPHIYRTLGGRPGGKGSIPAPYDLRKLEQPELYDFQNDVSETRNVLADHPDIVKRLEAFGEKMRADLGDTLTKRIGAGVREPGRHE